jgi:hypothetical protein
VDAFNAGLGTFVARKVRWDTWEPDAGTPTAWRCNDAGLPCFCVAGNCTDAGPQSYPPADADAVFYDTNSNPFDFTGGGLAPEGCF